MGHKIAVPLEEANPDEALRRAIELARGPDFKQKRRKFYDWQEDIRTGMLPEKASEEMDEMIHEYNRCVEKAVRKIYYKFAFTVAGIAVGLAGTALGNPLATAAAFLSVVEFATLDRKPVIEVGESAPAAMFHDVKKILGWSRSRT